MKGYWLVKNNIDKIIEISFPDADMFLINSLMSTLNYSQIVELRDKLLEVNLNTKPFVIEYEYGSLDIGPVNIVVHFTMFEQESECCLYTEVYRNAMVEYVEEYDKMMEESNGLSK